LSHDKHPHESYEAKKPPASLAVLLSEE